MTDIVQVKHENFSKRVIYAVSYNEDGCDIKCSCHLFEFRGIVCRHMVKILIEKDVKEIPSRYILTRWRKDVKRRHSYIINCYDDLRSGEQTKQFDHLCTNFYEAAHFANSREKYEYLMECITMEKEELIDDSSWGVSSNVDLASEDALSLGVDQVSGSTARLLSPLKVRGRGRPPFKRKEPKVDTIMKNKNKRNNKGKNKKKKV